MKAVYRRDSPSMGHLGVVVVGAVEEMATASLHPMAIYPTVQVRSTLVSLAD